MHLKSLTCALVAVLSPVLASDGWFNDIDRALEQAAKEKKSVYVKFTGSDWCAPCQTLETHVLKSENFKKLAKKNLLLVELDFPRDKTLSKEQTTYNREMAGKYSVDVYPTAFLLDAKGRVFWKRKGNGDRQSYLSDLSNALKNRETILGNLDKANNAEGLKKARFLKAAYDAMAHDLKESHSHLVQEIISLDPDDSLGLARKKSQEGIDQMQEQELRKFLDSEVLPLMKKEKVDEAIACLQGYLEKPDLTKLTRQRLYQIIARACIRKQDRDGAISALNEVCEIDSKSDDARKAREVIKELKQKNS